MHTHKQKQYWLRGKTLRSKKLLKKNLQIVLVILGSWKYETVEKEVLSLVIPIILVGFLGSTGRPKMGLLLFGERPSASCGQQEEDEAAIAKFTITSGGKQV